MTKQLSTMAVLVQILTRFGADPSGSQAVNLLANMQQAGRMANFMVPMPLLPG